MRSIILSTAARYLMPLLLMFSIFVLLRGHDEPGGGFVGGLVAASGFALYVLSDGVEATQRALRFSPRVFIATGLLIAVLSALFPLLLGETFMKGLWASDAWKALPGIGVPGTPFFFDIGVYLVVLGVVVGIVFAFFEDE